MIVRELYWRTRSPAKFFLVMVMSIFSGPRHHDIVNDDNCPDDDDDIVDDNGGDVVEDDADADCKTTASKWCDFELVAYVWAAEA